jgi:predicted nucleotidyltransferase
MTPSSAIASAPADVQEDLAQGVEILKSGGCSHVYVLGSVAEGRSHPGSDIDFAVRGCPPASFFKLQGRLLLELGRPADLIDLDVDPDLSAFLEREANLVHVG